MAPTATAHASPASTPAPKTRPISPRVKGERETKQTGGRGSERDDARGGPRAQAPFQGSQHLPRVRRRLGHLPTEAPIHVCARGARSGSDIQRRARMAAPLGRLSVLLLHALAPQVGQDEGCAEEGDRNAWMAYLRRNGAICDNDLEVETSPRTKNDTVVWPS